MSMKPMKRIVQRFVLSLFHDDHGEVPSTEHSYIPNPLLVHGKKFDIRCYMLIANVKPLIILYHPGYLRLSMFHFDPNDGNLLTHLTNQVCLNSVRSLLFSCTPLFFSQYMQKKDPKYSDLKEDTAWTMEQFK